MEKLTPNVVRENREKPAVKNERKTDLPKAGETARMPARALTALKEGASLRDMQPEDMRQLAQTLGNSRLLELVSGGGSGPETFSFSRPEDAGEEECNNIHAMEPTLVQPPEAHGEAALPRGTFDPKHLKDKNDTRANYPDLFWNAPEQA